MELRHLILDVLIQHLPIGGPQTDLLYAIADQIVERIEAAAVIEPDPAA